MAEILNTLAQGKDPVLHSHGSQFGIVIDRGDVFTAFFDDSRRLYDKVREMRFVESDKRQAQTLDLGIVFF